MVITIGIIIIVNNIMENGIEILTTIINLIIENGKDVEVTVERIYIENGRIKL